MRGVLLLIICFSVAIGSSTLAIARELHLQGENDTLSSVKEVYGDDHESIEQLFPSTNDGCINYGFWDEIIKTPITLEERLNSQKRLYFYMFEIAKLELKDHVLEVGCGRGHGVNWGKELVTEYLGIDLLQEQVTKCKINHPHIASNFFVGPADTVPFSSDYFDKVLCVEASQHFPDFFSFGKEAHRVLKTNGKLVLCTLFFKDDDGEQKTRRIMPDNVVALDHMIKISQSILNLEQAGFKVEKIESIGKYTFQGFCLWAKQVNCSTPHTQKWIDIFSNGWIDYFVIIASKE